MARKQRSSPGQYSNGNETKVTKDGQQNMAMSTGTLNSPPNTQHRHGINLKAKRVKTKATPPGISGSSHTINDVFPKAEVMSIIRYAWSEILACSKYGRQKRNRAIWLIMTLLPLSLCTYRRSLPPSLIWLQREVKVILNNHFTHRFYLLLVLLFGYSFLIGFFVVAGGTKEQISTVLLAPFRSDYILQDRELWATVVIVFVFNFQRGIFVLYSTRNQETWQAFTGGFVSHKKRG